MLTININNLHMEYGDKELFKIKSQQVNYGDKIGIIGGNGCGKTTLLDIIAGKIAPTSGTAKIHTDFSYIEQLDNEVNEITDTQQRYAWSVPEDPQSGGEIMRQKIAQALSCKADILPCDEPTSNLDEQGIIKLENTLKAYRGTLMLISHDRELINSVCDTIWELDGGLKVYSGNYDSYIVERNKLRANTQKEFEKYLGKKKNLLKAVSERSHKARGMTKAPSRMGKSEARLHKGEVQQRAGKVSSDAGIIKKRLENLDIKSPPKELPSFKLSSISATVKSSKTAVRAINLSYSYGDNTVFSNISFNISKGVKLAITGSNGSGKTTLLNCIVRVECGAKISPGNTVGYFKQDLIDMDEQETILSYVLENSEMPQYMVRTVLARLGIRQDDVFKKIKVLSGGERCKIALASLICKRCSILILDEPTNYLDIYVLEALETMLQEYDGTLILVTHDRYFRQRVTDTEINLDELKNSNKKSPS